MSQPPYYESLIDKAIREAQERGEFDNLPGAGKPLDLGDSNDPDWWIKRYAAREELDLGDALPGPLALRREASRYPDSVVDLADEQHVRDVIEDYNKRVLADRLRPAFGQLPPLLAKTLDVDEMVDAWRRLREDRFREERETERAAGGAVAEAQRAADRSAESRRSWWSRLRRQPSTGAG